MNIVLTLGRSVPTGSNSIYLDFKRHEVSRGRERARLEPKQFIAVACMLASPCPITPKELVDLAYDSADGGPDDALRAMFVAVFRARKRLASLGIGFNHLRGWGYESADLWEV